MKTARFSCFRALIFGAMLLGGAFAAQAADENTSPDPNMAYDLAMVECMNEFFKNDREAAANLYNGRGFEWTPERDRKIETCMRQKGFKLDTSRESRLGVPGQYDPEQPDAEAFYEQFRQDLLKYGGPEALAEIENYNARFEENADLPRSTTSLGDAGAGTAGAGGKQPEGSKPEEKPEEEKKNYIYVPTDKNQGPKPIWLDTQRPN